MDVIILSTIVAQAATALVDELQARRLRNQQLSEQQQPAPPPTPQHPAETARRSEPTNTAAAAATAQGESESENENETAAAQGEDAARASDASDAQQQATGQNADNGDERDENDDDSLNGRIAKLEAQLAELQNKAKTLTSPDAFVQYAQVTRQANRVEKQLDELKAERRASAPEGDFVDDGFEALASWVSSAAGGLGGQAARGAGRSALLSSAVQVLHTVFLWVFFRYGHAWRWSSPLSLAREGGGGGGAAAGLGLGLGRVPCQALRPLARLLASRVGAGSAGCDEGDWQCAADALTTCRFGVAGATVMTNVAVRAIRAAFFRRE